MIFVRARFINSTAPFFTIFSQAQTTILYKAMNSTRIILLLLLTATIFLMLSVINCRDPYDFEPNPDTLLDPPAAPQLLSPENNYVYMAISYPFNIYIYFNWTEISDAEDYTLELVIDTFAPVYYAATSNQWTIILMDRYRFCDYSWRGRAYSAAWKFYTSWSETRSFEARWQPDGPPLIYPPNNHQFIIDSLPEVVDLQWQSIADEEYYNILVGQNFDTLMYDFSNDTCYAFLAETTGTFWWQIRAGSPKWQYESNWSNRWYFVIDLR